MAPLEGSTPHCPTTQLSNDTFEKVTTLQLQPNASLMLTGVLRQAHTLTIDPHRVILTTLGDSQMDSILCFGHLLPLPPTVVKFHAYCAGLTPSPSALCPHCPAKEHLHLWHPSTSCSVNLMSLTDADLEWMLSIVNISWAQGTCKTYSVGLLVFYIFCDTCNILDLQHCPMAPLLIVMFIASCAGSYSGAIFTNYIFSKFEPSTFCMAIPGPWMMHKSRLPLMAWQT